MEKDKFLVVTVVILFILNLFTLGYVLYGRGEPIGQMFGNDGPGPEERFDDGRGPDRRGPENRKPDMMIISRLKLDPEQVMKFEELKREHRKQTEDLLFRGKKQRDEYFSLLKNDTPDTVRASQLLDQIGQNQKELDRATFSHFMKLRELCNADQKKLFDVFIEELAASLKQPPPGK